MSLGFFFHNSQEKCTMHMAFSFFPVRGGETKPAILDCLTDLGNSSERQSDMTLREFEKKGASHRLCD